MDERISNAKLHVENAEKATIKTNFLGKSKPDWDSAIINYEKAVNHFMIANSFQDAVKCYEKISDCQSKIGLDFMAGKAMKNAADISHRHLKKVETASDYYLKAAEFYKAEGDEELEKECLEKAQRIPRKLDHLARPWVERQMYNKKCKFFQLGRCTAGKDCRFVHEIEKSDEKQSDQPRITIQLNKKISPVDPITSELNQLERRFRSTFKRISQSDSEEVVEFDMVPSDPDFPFELDALKISLTVFNDYPNSVPQIRIRNSEIPPELIAKIEKGWLLHLNHNKNRILLDQFKWLDKNLEQLLIAKEEKEEKEETITGNQSSLKFYTPGEIKVSTNTDKTDKNEIDNLEEELVQSLSMEKISTGDAINTNSSINTHRGTQIRVPKVQIVNIGLLKCISLSISLNCPRCKSTIDTKLSPCPIDSKDGVGNVWLSCSVCSLSVGARYRADLVHAGSTSLGYLDLSEEVGIRDILPSSFSVSCMDGHETSHGLKSVLTGVEYRVSCQECFSSMKLQIEQFKFVKLSPNIIKPANLQLKKPKKVIQELGISLGSPLPNNGACEHYKKSYRWLRFPCCTKVYPCDICHELKKDDGHEMIWANRMICGFCSREQTYSQKPCACGRELTRKDSGGFWEGGKGTRDTIRMSKRDSHKYKGINKTKSNKRSSKD